MSGDDLAKGTYTIAEAAALLGICRKTAYRLAGKGEFPTPILRVGNRWVIPRGPLNELLGLS